MDKLEFTNEMLKCPLFEGLETDEMFGLLNFAKFKDFKAKESIVKENGLTDVFFVVATGGLEVFIASTSQQGGIVIKDLKQGDLFGEMALLGIEKRTASVRTKYETRLIIWNAVDCLDYFKLNKSVGYVVMKNLSGILGSRVRDMNLLLRNYADTLGPSAVKYL